MSDIVKRLLGNTGKYPGFENLNTEAAAEIERLRARVAELESDNADFKKLIADELAETFKLFGVLGLNEADDFGTKTAIEAVRERIESIKADRDRLLGACKEANEWLVAMTLKAAFNQDNKAAQDEAASIVREVTSHISKAIAARAANGEVGQ